MQSENVKKNNDNINDPIITENDIAIAIMKDKNLSTQANDIINQTETKKNNTNKRKNIR